MRFCHSSLLFNILASIINVSSQVPFTNYLFAFNPCAFASHLFYMIDSRCPCVASEPITTPIFINSSISTFHNADTFSLSSSLQAHSASSVPTRWRMSYTISASSLLASRRFSLQAQYPGFLSPNPVSMWSEYTSELDARVTQYNSCVISDYYRRCSF